MLYTLQTNNGEYYNNEKRHYLYDVLILFIGSLNDPRSWIVECKGKVLNAYTFHNLHLNRMREDYIYTQFIPNKKPKHVSFRSLSDRGILICNHCKTRELCHAVYTQSEKTIEICETFYELHRSCK